MDTPQIDALSLLHKLNQIGAYSQIINLRFANH